MKIQIQSAVGGWVLEAHDETHVIPTEDEDCTTAEGVEALLAAVAYHTLEGSLRYQGAVIGSKHEGVVYSSVDEVPRSGPECGCGAQTVLCWDVRRAVCLHCGDAVAL